MFCNILYFFKCFGFIITINKLMQWFSNWVVMQFLVGQKTDQLIAAKDNILSPKETETEQHMYS